MQNGTGLALFSRGGALAAALAAALLALLGPRGSAAEGGRRPPAPAAAAPPAAAHPQDGPDVDFRIRIEQDRIDVTVRCNLVFVDQFVEIPRESPDRLHEVEFDSFALALSELFTDALTVRADGRTLEGQQTNFRHSPAIVDMLYLYPTFGARSMAECRLQLEYPLEDAPTRVAFAWDLFPPNLSLGGDPTGLPPIDVPGQLHDGEGDVPFLLTAEEPELIWHGVLPDPEKRFLPVPQPPQPVPLEVSALSLLGGLGAAVGLGLAAFSRRRGLGLLAVVVCAAGAWAGRGLLPVALPFERPPALPSEDDAREIFRPLHENIYAAFDSEREDEIYAALERSVEGELLDGLYGQVYRSLILEEEGGAVARVVGIDHRELDVETVGELPGGGLGFLMRARWTVDGRVTHYGHSHERRTEYLARYTVRQGDSGPDGASGWRIADDEILEQRILSAVSTDPADGGGPQTLGDGPAADGGLGDEL